MGKKIAIVVIVLLVILAGVFYAMHNKKDTTEVKDDAATTNTKDIMEAKTEKQTLKGLLAGSQSKKCTFKGFDDGSAGEGMVYVGKGKMRSDFTFKAATQTFASHMIVDGTTSYVWMDGQNAGYKMDFNAMQENAMKGAINNTGQANFDPNKDINFSCDNWSVDNAQFTVPTNIKFQDMTAMMQSMTPPAGMQAVCEQLTGEAKAQCMKATQ